MRASKLLSPPPSEWGANYVTPAWAGQTLGRGGIRNLISRGIALANQRLRPLGLRSSLDFGGFFKGNWLWPIEILLPFASLACSKARVTYTVKLAVIYCGNLAVAAIERTAVDVWCVEQYCNCVCVHIPVWPRSSPCSFCEFPSLVMS